MTKRKKEHIALDDLGPKIDDFSDKLKAELRKLFTDKNAPDDPEFGHPADAFVANVLEQAWWAKSERHWQRFESDKEELRAESRDLLKRLTEIDARLRRLSPGLYRLLGVDPLEYADKLAELIPHVKSANGAIGRLPRTRRPDETDRRIALELAIRVLRVLKDSGIAPAATGNSYFGYVSDAVLALKNIADDIGLVLSLPTWRDIVDKAKKAAPDLSDPT